MESNVSDEMKSHFAKCRYAYIGMLQNVGSLSAFHQDHHVNSS